MRVYVVRKWPLWGRSRFVCWNITRVSLWLLCNVHFVVNYAKDPPTRPRWPKGTGLCNSEAYRCTHVDTCVARTWISYRCVPCHQRCTHRTSLVVKRKNFSSFPVAVNRSIKVGPLVVITENIMKRPVYMVMFLRSRHQENKHRTPREAENTVSIKAQSRAMHALC
jgi:hypothetical protein